MHTLHSRTAQIFKWWREEAEGQGAEDYDLWEVAWKPLLQGIAQFCTDRRKQVANSAITYLQRALLVPGLSAMGGGGWEACFQSVLFPLLEQLPRRADTTSRANTIMCKVFLQHLSALSPRPTFGALWVRIVEVQRALIAAPPDDPLTEAALESLKNMILVMDSVRIFNNGDGYNDLWYITWDKIGEFLPNLKDELFPQVQDNARPPASLPSHMHPSLPPTLPTLIPVGLTGTPTVLPIPPPGQSQPPHAQIQTPPMTTSPTQILGQIPNHQNPMIVPQTIQNIYQPLTSNVLTQNHRPIQVQTSLPMLSQMAHSPVNMGQTPPPMTSHIVAPTPVSGMVPIRNPLYDQAGLTSSVLLQPLNEMISTPIGITLQSQIPTLYPQSDVTEKTEALHEPVKTDPIIVPQETNVTSATQIETKPLQNASLVAVPASPQVTSSPIKNTILDILDDMKDVEQSELYAEYLTNPYNETKNLSTKEAALYEPVNNQKMTDTECLNEALLEKKSLSENATPLHRNKAQFNSTDNVRQESSIFNFSSYFEGGAVMPGSEVFDTLMSTQEG
ncbi:Golgi-specific brefeldin A-resistance guanine nucleotide exchange factor 1-like [Hyposmocoma kahamanoa]|uniref:Golgi-specific brefeldin A-resistance guanine nucleotide exchange factor 1-like n=1 Tax=Hyposmocoma kahamanoa TaxID=1477025 RepID=UPI000E6D8B19|nr:Golgi-specific brefeldin A-resistance guanine nucleotide exchange factor 1-like [Hyposmocoma kahamanoa]